VSYKARYCPPDSVFCRARLPRRAAEFNSPTVGRGLAPAVVAATELPLAAEVLSSSVPIGAIVNRPPST
jgi:hypothetical protein